MMKFRSILTFAAAGLSMLLGTIEALTVEYAHFTHYTTKEGLVANRVLCHCARIPMDSSGPPPIMDSNGLMAAISAIFARRIIPSCP